MENQALLAMIIPNSPKKSELVPVRKGSAEDSPFFSHILLF